MQKKRVQASPSRKRSKTARAPLYRTPGVYRGLGFPQQGRFNLRYVDRFDLTSTSAALASINLKANGLTTIRSGGHQPLYFDQIMALYNHYVVLGSKIKVTAALDSTASTDGGHLAVYLNDDTTITPNDITSIAEQSSAKAAQIASVGNQWPATVWCTYSAEKVFGPNPIQNAELKGDTTGNPGEGTDFSVVFQANAGSPKINVLCEIEYAVAFFELKDIANS